VLLVVGVEVVLFVLCEGILLPCVVDVEVAQSEGRSAEGGNLIERSLCQFWHLVLFLELELIVSSEDVVEVVGVGEGVIFALDEIGLFVEIEGIGRVVNEAVDVSLLEIESFQECFFQFRGQA
jgi:hypothetical protein